MAQTLQSLRSATPNAAPLPSTRKPGEFWVNESDKQFGFIDDSLLAEPLLAVRWFSTQTNYAVGDHALYQGTLYRSLATIIPGAFNPAQWQIAGGAVVISDTPPANPQPGNLWFDSVGAQLYIWYHDATSSQWVIANNQGLPSNIVIDAPQDSTIYGRVNLTWTPVLALAGGTMAGSLILAADPQQPLEAASKRYADTKLALAGGTLTGLLTLSGPPTATLHASTKAYADTKLPLAGGTLVGPLTLQADPSQPLQSATKQYVDAALASANTHADQVAPVGHIVMWVDTVAPPGWLLCDGSVYPIANIPALAAVMKNRYPGGNGSTTMAVPNLQAVFPIGCWSGGPPGTVGGEYNHVLSAAEMPPHGHGVTDPSHNHALNDPGHAHSLYDPSHNHGFNDPAHTHGMNDPGHAHGLADPGHAHSYQQWGSGGTPVYAAATYYQGNNNATTGGSGVGLGVYGAGVGVYLSYGGTRCYNSASGTGMGVYGAGTGCYNSGAYTGISIQSAGGGAAHNNMPPYLAFNFIIRYQ